jgi:hypothetical protein
MQLKRNLFSLFCRGSMSFQIAINPGPDLNRRATIIPESVIQLINKNSDDLLRPILREPQTGKLPAGGRAKEVAIGRADVGRGRNAGASAKHNLR